MNVLKEATEEWYPARKRHDPEGFLRPFHDHVLSRAGAIDQEAYQ